MKRGVVIALALTLVIAPAVVLAAVMVLELFEPPFYYAWKQERMVKRVLAANPDELLTAARELLQRRPGFKGNISPTAPDVPSALQKLKPTYIAFTTNCVYVDFGDFSNPFGISVYAPGVSRPATRANDRGPRQWIEGLWLHDDGQLEGYGQQIGVGTGR